MLFNCWSNHFSWVFLFPSLAKMWFSPSSGHPWLLPGYTTQCLDCVSCVCFTCQSCISNSTNDHREKAHMVHFLIVVMAGHLRPRVQVLRKNSISQNVPMIWLKGVCYWHPQVHPPRNTYVKVCSLKQRSPLLYLFDLSNAFWNGTAWPVALMTMEQFASRENAWILAQFRLLFDPWYFHNLFLLLYLSLNLLVVWHKLM